MSHFTVLVVCPAHITQVNVQGYVEHELAPFYEQVDSSSPFAVFNDVTEEYEQEYLTGTSEKIVMPDGRLLNPWDDEFRVPDPDLPVLTSHKAPEQLEWRKVPYKELYPTFDDFMRDWHEMTFNEEHQAYGFYHNPNAKWDWWLIGGRWEGMLTVKAGTDQNTLIYGEPGVFGHDEQAYQRPDGRLGCDGCRKADLDFDFARAQNIQSVKDRWEHMIANGHENDLARRYFEYGFDKNDTLESVLARKEQEEPFNTHAVLLNGHWFERGEMGWFGCVHDDKGKPSWCDEMKQIWTEIPEDAVVVVVDCHI